MTASPAASASKTPKTKTRVVFTLLAFGALEIIHLLPCPEAIATPSGLVALTPAGKACLAVLVAAVILWVSEAMDFSMSAVLLLALMPLLGITDGLKVLRSAGGVDRIEEIHGLAQGFYQLVKMSFGHRMVLFLLGIFILSAAINRSGLGRRIVLAILRAAGPSPRRVLFGVLMAGYVLAMWITAVAAAAFMAVVAAQLLERRRARPGESNFGKALMIACCWGPLIGGVATPAGAASNPIAIAYLHDMAGYTLTFTGWMTLGIPISLVLLPLGWLVLTLVFPLKDEVIDEGDDDPRRELGRLGRPDRREVWTIVVFALMVGLWVSSSGIKRVTGGVVDLPMEWVALLGGILLCLPAVEVLAWPEALKLMPWSAIVLMMASLAMGQMMYQTGAARWLAWETLSGVGTLGPVVRIAVVVTAVMVIKLFLASNAVTSAVMIPLLITMAGDLGLNVWSLAAPAALSASLGVIIITESPTNVIPYHYGYFSQRDFIKSGLIMSVIMVAVLTAVIVVVGKLTGMYQL